MKKKFVAKLLVMCMVISMLPLAIFAEDETSIQPRDTGIYTITMDAAAVNGTVTANCIYEGGSDTHVLAKDNPVNIESGATGVKVTLTAANGYVVDTANAKYTIYGVSNDTVVQSGSLTGTAVTLPVGNIVIHPAFKAAGTGGGGGGGTTTTTNNATVEEPTTSGGATTVEVAVESKTTGTTTTATVSQKDMNTAVDNAVKGAADNGTTPVVEIKVETTDKTETVKANLPTKSLETLAQAGGELKISSDKADTALDNTALEALAEQATGSDITLAVAPAPASALNAAQQAAVQGATVVDITITSGGKNITSFGGGKLSFSIAYTLPSGVTAAQVQVYYLTDRGNFKSHQTSFAGGKVTFTTTHLSKYVIGTKDMLGVSFDDVAFGQYYYDAVAWAVKANVTAGVSTTMFGPSQNCSRGQIMTFLWRSAGSPEPAAKSNPFTDVAEDAYYYKAVMWAVEKGITSGTSATTFSPDKTCTRAEAMTFLYASEGRPAVSGASDFNDVSANAYYNKAVTWAVKSEITAGTSATTFSPDKTCTRAEIVTFLFADKA